MQMSEDRQNREPSLFFEPLDVNLYYESDDPDKTYFKNKGNNPSKLSWDA